MGVSWGAWRHGFVHKDWLHSQKSHGASPGGKGGNKGLGGGGGGDGGTHDVHERR